MILEIPPLQWINDAVHALRSGENVNYVDGDGPFNSSTAFPAQINFAATFNDRLVYGMGDAIGIEARAFTNAGRGGVDLWAPNINPFGDPRWGRGQEVPGEDPYVGRRYAFNFVTGMQTGEDPRYYKAVSASKHFAAYDLEIWNGTDRDHFDAQVSTLIGHFLLHVSKWLRFVGELISLVRRQQSILPIHEEHPDSMDVVSTNSASSNDRATKVSTKSTTSSRLAN